MKSVEQFTQKEIEMMEFREKLFLEQVEQYRAAVTGEQESILPFVRDENGVYSEEKAWNLIEELIKCSEVYFQYMNQRRDSEKEEEFLNFWLNETSKEFLRDFFYCVIRIQKPMHGAINKERRRHFKILSPFQSRNMQMNVNYIRMKCLQIL